MRRSITILPVTLLLAVVLGLSACGGDEPEPATGTEGTSEAQRIQITIENGKVTPNGERVEVVIGQEVEFEVTADTEGELHVHSDPEQELPYKQGTTILELGTFDKAGIVEVESHDLHVTILQLEVQ